MLICADQWTSIIRQKLLDLSSLSSLDGRPVVTEDSNGEHYFKRLRLVGGNQIILESMDSGGDFEAVLLAMPGSHELALSGIWPVAGVLFELPG